MSNCEQCVNYVYNDEDDFYECLVNLDEDEFYKFITSKADACPYFRLDDEYIPYCLFEDKCDIDDCEDGRPLEDRPCYEPLKLLK